MLPRLPSLPLLCKPAQPREDREDGLVKGSLSGLVVGCIVSL